MSSRRMRLAAVMCLCLLMATGGCRSHASKEEPEHHFPAHKPADYPTAVERMRQVHQEILDGPLVAREIRAAHDHHGHSHDDDHHSHGHAHQHVQLNALQEIGDLVRWLPDLAADSDMAEEPWNRVYTTANQLELILSDASSRDSDEQRAAYLQHENEVDRHLRQLIEIKQQFPDA